MKSIKHFIFYLFLFILLPVSAQESTFKDKLSLKIGCNSTNSKLITLSNGFTRRENPKLNINVDLNYTAIRNLDLGVYLGYSKLPYVYNTDVIDFGGGFFGYENSAIPSTALSYGLNTNYHLIPLLSGEKLSRIDVYALAKIGLVSEFWSNDGIEGHYEPFLEYGFGFGAGYYFTKHIGVFGEYKIGRFYNDDKSQLRGGLVFKF